ncbi:Sm-like protein LSM7 SCDLUD_002851 [Saccharomycodes ludwigii]|uniref:Sm-like protein LSM7 n=1 Tax=Saccharomycodes ludwigii TaxID=36035 RepID=UPI001E8B8706|nr:hypothetical protein SCDLUD_002851 [Saccharomycodes ludwigii]KAH3901359.1 hypothetical protein SCDLUD_002851 [Saccharomycodes ludwigii]
MNPGDNQTNNYSNNNQRKKFQGPKRDAIMDLAQYKYQSIRVQLTDNRVVTGTLKGYDQLMNMVLDDAIEYIGDELDSTLLVGKRKLGFCVLRGTLLIMISPNYMQQKQESEK